jgi:hypothetical protein
VNMHPSTDIDPSTTGTQDKNWFMCPYVFNLFSHRTCDLSDQFYINHLQHLRTRETVRTSCSSYRIHVARMADYIRLFLTDTPTISLCLSIIVSLSEIRVVHAVASNSGRDPSAVAAQTPQRTPLLFRSERQQKRWIVLID